MDVSVRVSPVYGAGGARIGYCSIARDITDRKQAAAALFESSARSYAVLESALDAIITIDAEQHVIEWNPAAEWTFGYSRAEAMGRIMAELIIPPKLHDVHKEGVRRYLATGEGPILNKRIEVPARRASGAEFPAELTVVPISLSGRTLFTAYVRDITSRREAEQALQSSEARYRTLAEATAQIVWTNTPDGEMNSANESWGAFTGQSEAQYQGYGWANAVHTDDAQPTLAAWRLALDTMQPFVFEHRVRRHDGVYRDFAVRAVPVLEEGGAIREWAGIHTDITERKALQGAQELILTQQRQFLRDVLASVTDGRLILCNEARELPAPLAPAGGPVALSLSGALRELRHLALDAAEGMAEERRHDLVTAVSEAGMNAVTHGGGSGTAWVFQGADGLVQVRVEDHGEGIDLASLPKAALARGYSTKSTLGHGFKMMQNVDKVYLLTGPGGTTVVLEQGRNAALPTW